MSIADIRKLLETHLDGMTPALATAWENSTFVPVSNVPYQRVSLLLAQPDNPVQDAGYREQGIFQVTLCYPLQVGTAVAGARAEALRARFPKKLTLTDSGVTVTINRTAAIGNGSRDGDRWSIPVRISWHANVM